VGATGAGKVQVFNRSTNVQGSVQLSPTQILKSPQPRPKGYFGEALDVQGTLLAVGEPGGDGAASKTGAVHLFDLSATPYQTIETLSAPGGQSGDGLGAELLFDGGTLLATALTEDAVGVSDAGAVHMFRRDSQGVWAHIGRLESPTPVVGGEFGIGLAVSGTTIFIGAPSEVSGGLATGAVHVFERQLSGWAHVQTLYPDQPNDAFLFGASIQVVGDRMFVGAPGSNVTAGRAGEIQLFQRIGGLWQHDSTLQAPDLQTGDRFGLEIAVENGRLVTSAKGGDEPHFNSGNAYVYATDGSPPSPMTPLRRYVEAGSANTHYILIRPGVANAGDPYFVIGSAVAAPVPTLASGVLLPFALDQYSFLTYFNANQGPFRKTLGVLDAQGEATARIALEPAVTASLVGVTLRHATIVLDSLSLGPIGVYGPTDLTFVP
jgi:hypothetical protein